MHLLCTPAATTHWIKERHNRDPTFADVDGQASHRQGGAGRRLHRHVWPHREKPPAERKRGVRAALDDVLLQVRVAQPVDGPRRQRTCCGVRTKRGAMGAGRGACVTLLLRVEGSDAPFCETHVCTTAPVSLIVLLHPPSEKPVTSVLFCASARRTAAPSSSARPSSSTVTGESCAERTKIK